MGLGVAAMVITPGAATGQPADLFFDRAVLLAADGRCRVLSPEAAAALAAGVAQARGAALRAGAGERDLRDLEARARSRGSQVDCNSEGLSATAQRAEDAFQGYARLIRMTYRGEHADWRADRSQSRGARWRLSQEVRFGKDRMLFGLAGRDGASSLIAVAEFADGAAPSGARLMMRDTERTLGPYLPGGRSPLGSRMPSMAMRAFLAEARSPASSELLPREADDGWAVRFPQPAVRALAGLDPREAVAVEFMFADGRSRRAYVEVGDFAAGRAFVQLAAGR